MEKNPKSIKAFVITFISMFVLLLIVYFLFFRGGGGVFTKSITGLQKSFVPLLGSSKDKNLNVGIIGNNGSTTVNDATNTGGLGSSSGGTSSSGGASSSGGSSSSSTSSGGSSSGFGSSNNGKIAGKFVPQCGDGKDNDGRNGKDSQDKSCWKNPKDAKTYDKNIAVEYDFTNLKKVSGSSGSTSSGGTGSSSGSGGSSSSTGSGSSSGGSSSSSTSSGGSSSSGSSSSSSSGSGSTSSGSGSGSSSGSGISIAGNNTPQCNDGLDNDGKNGIDALDKSCWKNSKDPATYDKNILIEYDFTNLIIIGGSSSGIGSSGSSSGIGSSSTSSGVGSSSTGSGSTSSGVGSSSTSSGVGSSSTGSGSTSSGIGSSGSTSSGVGSSSTGSGSTSSGVGSSSTSSGSSSGLGSSSTSTSSSSSSTGSGSSSGLGSSGSSSGSGPKINLTGGYVPQCSDNVDNDNDGVKDDKDSDCHTDKNPNNSGSYDAKIAIEYDFSNTVDKSSLKPQCSDWIDTNGNGIMDAGDVGDNDRDGLIDEKDPGCHIDLNVNNIMSYMPTKTSELNFMPQCGDGLDNDGVNGADYNDKSCWKDGTRQSTYDGNIALEYDFSNSRNNNITPECGDGKDNDGKNGIDALDKSCWKDHTDATTYDATIAIEYDFSSLIGNGGGGNGINSCEISNFKATPDTIASGSSSTLTWSNANCTSVNISGLGAVLTGATGSATLSPTSTTTYIITGKLGNNISVKTATINVTTTNNTTGSTITPQCSDWIDVNKDGIKNAGDTGDNDNNDKIDEEDPSCHTDHNANNATSYDPKIAIEYDFTQVGPANNGMVPQCSDWVDTNKDNIKNTGDTGDNDINGKIDNEDPSCHTDHDATNAKSYDPKIAVEYNFSNGSPAGNGFTPQCSDWVDTNKDGKKDKGDAGDNDRNGKIDEEDPSCHTDHDATNAKSYDAKIAVEYDFSGLYVKGGGLITECNDGLDNDNDGQIDRNDPQCHTDLNPYNNGQDIIHPDTYNTNTLSESAGVNQKPQCSDGVDNDKKNGIDELDPGCWKDNTDPNTYDPNDNFEYNLQGNDYVSACTLSLMKDKLATNQTEIDKLEAAAILAYNNSFVIKAGTRGPWPKVTKGGGGTGPIGTGVTPTTTQCSDAVDNDNNGLKDMSDPSCHTDGNKYNAASYDKNILVELNPPASGLTAPDCFDKIDNDGNGLVDAQDPGCWTNMNDRTTYNPSDNYEKIEITECNDAIDNDGNGVIDSKDPACWTNQKDSRTYNPNLPYENLPGSITLPHTPYTRVTVTTKTKNGTLEIPVILLGIYPGNVLPATLQQINTYINSMGYNIQAVDSSGRSCFPPPAPPQCNDWVDTNGNGLVDKGDKGDNDGDGLIDRADPGCHIDNDPIKLWDKFDNNENNTGGIKIHPPYTPACSDTADNDGDGFTDDKDPGCHSDLNPNNVMSYEPNKTSEFNFIPACRDGEDNDADGLKDQFDPGCHTDLDPTNTASYDPDKPTEFNLIPQCSDRIDNDNNKLMDDTDPACYTDLKITKKANGTIDTTKYDPNKILEFKMTPQCSDGVDNDGKNGADEKDPGCWSDINDPTTYDPNDNFEYKFDIGVVVNPNGAVAECNDGIDNDKDGLTDKDDPDCNENYIPKVPECNDGIDNDNDLWIDGIDPDCLKYGGNPPANMANDIWLKDKLYEDPKNATRYNPNHQSEGSKIVAPQATLDTTSSCVDVPLTFTDEELALLDGYTREFNLIAPTLKTDADILTEQDKQKQYEDLVAKSVDLTKQCINQKKTLGTLLQAPTDPSKPQDTAIPLEMLPNPYYSGPGYLAALGADKLAEKYIGKTEADKQENLDTYFTSLPKATQKLYAPFNTYIHTDPTYGIRGDESSRVGEWFSQDPNNRWNVWQPRLNSIGYYDYWNSWNAATASPRTSTPNDDLPSDKNHFLYYLYTGDDSTPLPTCSDGIDNDGDGYTDDQDEGCYKMTGFGATSRIIWDINGNNEANDIDSGALPPTDHHYKVNPSVKLTIQYTNGVMDTFMPFGQASSYGGPASRPPYPSQYWRTQLQMRSHIGCIADSGSNPGYAKGDEKGINNPCQNQPKFGLYDIKDIVDGAWVDYMSQRNFATVPKEHLEGHLSQAEIYPGGYTNITYKVPADNAKWYEWVLNPIYALLHNSFAMREIHGSDAIPQKPDMAKGTYDARPNNPLDKTKNKTIGIWGILNMYAGDYNAQVSDNITETTFGHFCNWTPDMKDDGSGPKPSESDNIIAHNDPHDKNIVVCTFMRGMLQHFNELGQMDIRDLKRQVDDIVYKVHDAPDEERYWGTARPLLDFEQSYKVW